MRKKKGKRELSKDGYMILRGTLYVVRPISIVKKVAKAPLLGKDREEKHVPPPLSSISSPSLFVSPSP